MAPRRAPPSFPASTARRIRRFSTGSPPSKVPVRRDWGRRRSGSTVNLVTSPLRRRATWLWPRLLNSSSPSSLWTTMAFSTPRFRSTSAKGTRRESRQTPTTMSWARAGLANGPTRLKTVRMPRAFRRGATFPMTGWRVRAKRKAIPVSRRERSNSPGGCSRRTPASSSTSAAPQREETARLPCLATVTPAPAATRAAVVEMLKERPPSPPVPTMSAHFPGATTEVMCSRRKRAHPVNSSTASPR